MAILRVGEFVIYTLNRQDDRTWEVRSSDGDYFALSTDEQVLQFIKDKLGSAAEIVLDLA